MSDMTAVICAIEDRRDMVADLVKQISNECPSLQPIIHWHRPGDPPRVDFPRAMEKARWSERPWVIQFEDDVSLCPDFGKRLSDALSCAPDLDCIRLFSRSRADLDAMENGMRWRKTPPKAFSMSQCFVIRADLLDGFRDWSVEWYKTHPQHQRAADLLMADWLSKHKARVFAHIPSLVQHRPVVSTLPGHYGHRQSESFKVAFGEVDA